MLLNTFHCASKCSAFFPESLMSFIVHSQSQNQLTHFRLVWPLYAWKTNQLGNAWWKWEGSITFSDQTIAIGHLLLNISAFAQQICTYCCALLRASLVAWMGWSIGKLTSLSKNIWPRNSSRYDGTINIHLFPHLDGVGFEVCIVTVVIEEGQDYSDSPETMQPRFVIPRTSLFLVEPYGIASLRWVHWSEARSGWNVHDVFVLCQLPRLCVVLKLSDIQLRI